MHITNWWLFILACLFLTNYFHLISAYNPENKPILFDKLWDSGVLILSIWLFTCSLGN